MFCRAKRKLQIYAEADDAFDPGGNQVPLLFLQQIGHDRQEDNASRPMRSAVMGQPDP
jgi:hypothetical protein